MKETEITFKEFESKLVEAYLMGWEAGYEIARKDAYDALGIYIGGKLPSRHAVVDEICGLIPGGG